MHDATKLETDEGVMVNLVVDPPIVVMRLCDEAVQRWRWRRVEKLFPVLRCNGSGRGALMEPVWRLLAMKDTDDWNGNHKGCLRSVLAGRQYPQVRVMAAGWAKHNRCLACLSKMVDEAKGGHDDDTMGKRSVRHEVEATDDIMARAPIGDLNHRAWSGECLKEMRKRHADPEDVRITETCNIAGHPAWERAMAVRPPAPMVRPSKVGTFWWHVRPRELPVQGIVYPDGSELDARVPEMSRTGWAFVITNEDGVVLAAAYGVPPPWITDIGGAESWALFQSTSCTIPALCKYWPDCLPVKQAVAKGVEAATNPRNPLARVHTMLVEAFGDDGKQVGWMPSHCTKKEVGVARKSDGSFVTEADVKATSR